MRSLLVALVFLVACGHALVTWNLPLNGDWSAPTSWASGLIPSLTSDVLIDVPGTYTVTVDVAANSPSLTLGFLSNSITGVVTLAVQSGVTATFGTVGFTAGVINIGSGAILNVTHLIISSAVNITGAGSLYVNGNLTYDGTGIVQIASNLYVQDVTLTSGASLSVTGGGWANGAVTIDGGAFWVKGPFNFGVSATFPEGSSGVTGNLTFYSNYSHSLPKNVTISVAYLNIGWTSKVWFNGVSGAVTVSGDISVGDSGKLYLDGNAAVVATNIWLWQTSSAEVQTGSSVTVSSAVELRDYSTLWFTQGAQGASDASVQGTIDLDQNASINVAGTVRAWLQDITVNTLSITNFEATVGGNGTVYVTGSIDHLNYGDLYFTTITFLNGTLSLDDTSVGFASGGSVLAGGSISMGGSSWLTLSSAQFTLPSAAVTYSFSGTVEFTSSGGQVEAHKWQPGTWKSAVVVSKNATLTTQGPISVEDDVNLYNGSSLIVQHYVSSDYNVVVNDESELQISGSGVNGVNLTADNVQGTGNGFVEVQVGNWISATVDLRGSSQIYFIQGTAVGSTGVTGSYLYVSDDASIAVVTTLVPVWINSKIYFNYYTVNQSGYDGKIFGVGALYINGSADYSYGGSLTFDIDTYLTSEFDVYSAGVLTFNGGGGTITSDGLLYLESESQVVITNPAFTLNASRVNNNGVISFNSILASQFTLQAGSWDGDYEVTGNANLQTNGTTSMTDMTVRNNGKFYVKHKFDVSSNLEVHDSASLQVSANVTAEYFVLTQNANYLVVSSSAKSTPYIATYWSATINGTLRVIPSFNIFGAGNITVLTFDSRYGKFSGVSVADAGSLSSLPSPSLFAKATLFNQGANVYYQSNRVVVAGNGQSSGAASISASASLIAFVSLSLFLFQL